MMNNKALYRRVGQLLYPYRYRILGMGGIMALIMTGNIFIPLLQQKIVDEGLIGGDLNLLIRMVVLVIMLALFTKIGEFLQSTFQMKIHLDFIRNMETDVLNHALRLKADYIHDNGLFTIIQDTSYFVNSIANITGEEVAATILQACKFFGVLIGLFLINWKLTLLILITIPIRMKISDLMSSRVGKYSEESIKVQEKIHAWENDIFSAATEIKLWNLYDKKRREYDDLLRRRDKIINKLNLNVSLSMLSGEGFQEIVINALYILCGLFMWQDGFSIGGAMAFIAYASSLMEPVALFSYLKVTLAEIEPALEKYDEFYRLELEESSDEYQQRRPIPETESIILEIHDVVFRFGERDLFSKGNFSIKTGEKVALIGENGVGKSTLINLILRFYQPAAGHISLNGNDINGFRLGEYRELFSVVMQDPYLFQGTIRDNLTVFGKNSVDNTLYQDELLSFINKLPDNENTQVGNDSSHLSGGEKQKVALYRALNSPSKILIMDEPTANYDVRSEKDFERVILDNNKDITIIITHDPQMLKHMDEIILIKDQNIICFDSYDGLCSREKQYRIANN